MVNDLRVLTIELKSAQSIIKILFEERKVSGTSPLFETINSQIENTTERESESGWTEIRRKYQHSSQASPTTPMYTVFYIYIYFRFVDPINSP
jgi:hypothetical protein